MNFLLRRSGATGRIVLVALEATLWFLLGIFACIVHYGFVGHVEGFASRWEGSCTGWSRALAVLDVTGSLALWWAYTAIAVTIHRLHPVVHEVRASLWTIRLTAAFVVACGGTHLLGAYAAFNPVYTFTTYFKLLAAAISVVSVFFVAGGLIRVFTRIQAARAKLEAPPKDEGAR